MKNLSPYLENSFDFYKDLVKTKRNTKTDPNYKNRLKQLENNIESLYKNYKIEFDNNSLENLTPFGYIDPNKSDLLKLYNYNSKKLQELKVTLTTDSNGRINNTCQNCSISEVSTFDHYLPKEYFSEFAINPLNLIPCCSSCNSNKGKKWKDKNTRLFINQYLDVLPQNQYLFVKILSYGDTIDVEFYLDDKNLSDPNQYIIIKNHYINLHLLQRFKENSHSIISELENTINIFKNELPLELIRDMVIEVCNGEDKFYGSNYWKNILKRSLINDTEFMKRY